MRIGLVLVAAALAGCSTTAPAPNYHNGNYYMAGDPDCARSRIVASNVIQCFTKDEKPTVMRRAMTQQELAYYYQSRLQSQNQAQSVNQPMPMVSPPQIAMPQVLPIAPPGGNQVRCISTGIYTNCRY